MDNGEQKAADPPNGPAPQGRVWIDAGVLRVEVPLFMPNGEYIAYGMLHKAALMVALYFKAIEREAAQQKGPRILTPAGMPRGN